MTLVATFSMEAWTLPYGDGSLGYFSKTKWVMNKRMWYLSIAAKIQVTLAITLRIVD